MIIPFYSHRLTAGVMQTEQASTAHQDDSTTSDNAISDLPSL
jgi:hypothetical protein